MAFEILALPWWAYALGITSGLLLGACVAAVGYFIYIKWENHKIKKNTPLQTPLLNLGKNKVNRKDISIWLKHPETRKNITQDAGNAPKLTQKEVIEDDKQRSKKFREFEKLRRAAKTKPGTYGKTRFADADFQQSKRGRFPNKSSTRNSESKDDDTRSVDFD